MITVTGGQVRTLTITPTAPPEPAQTGKSRDGGGGILSNAGRAAGLFVGIVLLIMIIAAVVIGLWAKRRRNAGRMAVRSNAGDDTPQRRPSRLSQMALVSPANPRSAGETVAPGIQTSDWGLSNPADKSPTGTITPLDRRTSYGRMVDQRLDPVALWNPLHDNGSHVSVRSFRDDQDYSRRMLRVSFIRILFIG